ncbi:MAG: hypothetical protein C5B51_21030 [Terriglobia bacterium]|nr:MAG: hypothetical protein C5B51_21030 [Terriglobia bacterium]
MLHGIRLPRFTATLTFFVTLVITALPGNPARAQVAGATLSGTVSDPSGAAIAGARVAIVNNATGVTREALTDSAGFYSTPNLLPGNYDVTVSAPGFSSTKESNLTLTVGAQQVLNMPLKIGESSQTVQVEGVAPQIQLGSSTLSAEVTGTTVRELPLNGRDWASLATLQPGVATVRAHPQGTQASRGLGMQMTISGNRPTQNSFRLDGAIVNDYSNAGPGSVLGQNLGVDAIQEFSVLTSNYSAEYGFTSGGVINAVTRSGANTFHGSAFDFLRNDKLDATNFFNNSSGLHKSPLKQNQFGGSGGWRILKDRLFLFGDYEGVRQSRGTAQQQFTISEAVRAGRVTNLSNGAVTTTPIDPTIQKFLALYPVTNGSGHGTGENANVGQFNWTAVQSTTENFYTFRADEKFSARDSLFVTYVRDPSFYLNPIAFNEAKSKTSAYRQAIVVEETHLISASFANTVRLALNRTNGITNHFDDGSQTINPAANDPSLAMIPGGNYYRAPATNLSGTGITMQPGGLHALTQQDIWSQIFQVYDDAFLTRGNHGLKFGFSILALHNDIIAINGINGNATFTSSRVTPQEQAACTQANGAINASCGSLINFLTNQPRTAAPPADLTRSNKHYLRDKVFGVYLQDDWRLRPGLTLNLGLRYETAMKPSEKNGEVGYLRSLYGPPTDLVNYFYTRNPTTKNFEPRIGFAWDPFRNGKTAIRGSVGVFDVLPLPYILQLYAATTAPFTTPLGTVGPPNTAVPPPGVWPYAIPSLAGNSAPQSRIWAYLDPNIKRNYVYQYNFNIQRQLTASTTLVIGYTGSHGIHNPFLDEGANSVLPVNIGKPAPGVGYYWPIPYTLGTGGAGNAALLNPSLGVIRSIMWQSRSYYNALQVKLDKRVSHGFQVQGSFTWSKSIDDTSGSAAADTFTNEWNAPPWYDLRLNRGLSGFNVGRNLVINGLWNAPAPKGLGAIGNRLFGGWQLGLISAVADGIPITPSMGMDGSDLLGEIIPTINPPQFLASSTCTSAKSVVNVGNPNAYLNPKCLGLVPQTAANTPFCDVARALTLGVPGTCPNIRGNLGRNSIIGPGLVNFDFSMVKNNYIRKISESFNVQFRAEFFNVLNRANFAPPALAANQGGGPLQIISSVGQPVPGFGLITSTQTPARQIQFALRVIW